VSIFAFSISAWESSRRLQTGQWNFCAAYALDLRQYASWYQQRHIRLFQARRADIECFARDLEARGRARATITRRLCTIAGFYRYAVEEDLLDHSPAAHVRRPRLDYESHATGWTAMSLARCWSPPGLASPPSMR
jgi:integrase/recombinase XerD